MDGNTDESSMDKEQPPPERKERKLKCFHLFNCDKTYKLDIVEKLLDAIKEKVTSFDISTATKKSFRLFEMSELCTTIKSGPPMDFAIFVVHANESRLSINEENAGIGYARFYKALQRATDDRVIVVIGGDDNYKGPAEEERALLSRWVWRQISSQFKEEYMDGRKSFIFSWNKKHRAIHEEALLHFLDPEKRGQKFVHEPKRQPTLAPLVDPNQQPKSQETSEVHAKAKTERNSSDVQQMKDGIPDRQKAETRREQFSVPQSSDGKKDKIRGNQNSSDISWKSKMEGKTDDSSMDKEQPPPERKERKLKCFHLFNCDETYKLDIVEKLLDAIKEKVTSFDISTATKRSFRLFEMSELCTTIRSGPPMDFAIFVVHANESRLSINEENAGIGYARFYKALQQATDDRVIVVIGGDDNYKGPAEEEGALLSRWTWRQISSQFKEEYKDGRKSFIFSWNKKHREIHEEALLHFLDPEKRGQKFVHEPKRQPTLAPLVDPNQQPKSQETSEVHGEAKIERNSSDVQQKRAQFSAHQVQPSQQKIDDQPVKSTSEADAREKHSLSKPGTASHQHLKAKAENTVSLGKKTAIICRDQSDITIIEDVCGDELLSIVPIFSGSDAGTGSEFLRSTHSMRSCFIVVEAKTMKEEQFQHKPAGTPYENLLRTARETVDKKVVIIICNDKGNLSHNDEDVITNRIKLLLGDKGIILWWKGNKDFLHQTQNPQLGRSKSFSGYEGVVESMESDAHTINPEDTVLLETRLRHGTISYRKEDLKRRLDGWTAPGYMVNKLYEKWQSTADAELLIYRENKTGTNETEFVVRPAKEDSTLSDSLKDSWQKLSGCFPVLGTRKRDGSPSSDPSDDLDLD